MDYNGYLNYSLDNGFICLVMLNLLKDQFERFPYLEGWGPC